jgi:hypothetical protein
VSAKLEQYFADEARRQKLKDASGEILDALSAAKPEVLKAYRAFEWYDMVVYPLTIQSGIGEVAKVIILRISPQEGLKRRVALAGKQLGHFGAFLEEGFRRNDITWGRLDAASVILERLAPGRQDLVEAAHRAIIVEQLQAELEERIKTGALPDGVKQTALDKLDDSAALLETFKKGEVYDLSIRPVEQLNSAGRAGVILEKITRSWAVERNVPMPRLIRFGVLLLAMLANMAVPRSLPRVLGTYWWRLLIVLFGLLGVVGYFVDEALLKAGIIGGSVVLLLGAAVLAIRAVIGERVAKLAFRVAHVVLAVGLVPLAFWAVRQSPEALRKRLLVDDWWGPYDTLAVKIAIAGVAAGVLIGMLYNLAGWAVAAWRRLKPD